GIILFGFITSTSFAAADRELLETKIESYLTENEETTAGVTTIIINKGQTLMKTAGHANREENYPIDAETVFEWGSVSKILIWISVLQLIEQGVLHLETDITTYLPDDFQTKTSYAKPITLIDLMNHTAGFDDSYTDLMLLSPSSIQSLRKTLETANIKQVFTPGETVA